MSTVCPHFLRLFRLFVWISCGWSVSAGAFAWTPQSQQAIAETAARLAPPDLYRQIVRHRAALQQGVLQPFAERDPARHLPSAAGGTLDQALTAAIDDAIRAIQAPRPFGEVVYRLGIVAHYLADANNPLAISDDDPEEGRYFADFFAYVESAEPRLAVVFYGFRPDFRRDGLQLLLRESGRRGQGFYGLIGREYRRIGFASGSQHFDDRSTAYGVAALAFSHAVSDIAQVLRYIWVTAGGLDTRSRVPLRGEQWMPLPRSAK